MNKSKQKKFVAIIFLCFLSLLLSSCKKQNAGSEINTEIPTVVGNSNATVTTKDTNDDLTLNDSPTSQSNGTEQKQGKEGNSDLKDDEISSPIADYNLKSINENSYKTKYVQDFEVFYFDCGSLPVATGYPLLSQEKINELVNSQDYEHVAKEIATMADAIRYFYKSGFKSIESDYIYNWSTHICGEQVIARRGGQCGGMVNAFSYLLKDDYELYYVLIDGHIMMAAHIEGYYYLLNPADYCITESSQSHFNYYAENSFVKVKHRGENLKEICDSMVDSGTTTYRFMTYKAEGDMFPNGVYADTVINLHENGMMGPDWYFPNGTNVTDWLGNGVHYANPDFYNPETGEKVHMIDWKTGKDWVDESLIT